MNLPLLALMVLSLSIPSCISRCWTPPSSSAVKPAPAPTPQTNEALRQATQKREQAFKEVDAVLADANSTADVKAGEWRSVLKGLDKVPIRLICEDLAEYQALRQVNGKIGDHYKPASPIKWEDLGLTSQGLLDLLKAKGLATAKGLVGLYNIDLDRRIEIGSCPMGEPLALNDTLAIWKKAEEILGQIGVNERELGSAQDLRNQILADYVERIERARERGNAAEVLRLAKEAWGKEWNFDLEDDLKLTDEELEAFSKPNTS